MKAVVYAGTRNVYEKMLTAAKSLLYNSKIDKIYFLTEDNDFPYPLNKKIECINVSNQTWIKPDCPNINREWGGYMNLMRLTLVKLFPDLDKILSLDNDTIVLEDISHLWDLNMSNYYAAGVRDTPALNRRRFYVNAGVMLYNLKQMREDKIDDKLLADVHSKKNTFPMQDTINRVLNGRILELPTEYNSWKLFMNYNPNKRKIIHYAGHRTYFQDEPLVQYYKNLEV